MKFYKLGRLSIETWNILYTEGILTGLTVKMIVFRLFAFRKMLRIGIPYWIMGYDRKQGKYLQEVYEKIREAEKNGEL
jgi:hypothetical protein